MSIDVVRDDLGLAGSPFTLTCIVELTDVNLSPPDVVWLGPDGSELTNSSQVSLHAPVTKSLTTQLIVEFSPMVASHAGKYDCFAQLINEETAIVSESIAVQSKLELPLSIVIHT